MANTLASLEQRVMVLLADLTHLNYTTALIDEGIRLAVREYSLASGMTETISGLDGEGLTSIPDNDCGLIVLGAAGFTASCKTIDGKQQFNLKDETPEAVLSLGQRLVQRFDRMLGTVRASRMRSSEIQAWGEGWGSV